MLNSLPIPWHWHIVEGLADLAHDTAWSKPLGGKIESWMHAGGLSTDGTKEYLDGIAGEHVTLYRKPSGQFWDGKLEMVNAPLENITDSCLLWEMDADELWTADQIMDVWDLFQMNPDRQSAQFRCLFFVGPDLYIQNEEVYGNHSSQEWKRVWRFQSGDRWRKHEPPELVREGRDVATIKPFTPEETKLHRIVFQHLGYVRQEQLQFKEFYYGYKHARSYWVRLQGCERFPVRLAEYFPWVNDDALVGKASCAGIVPLIKV